MYMLGQSAAHASLECLWGRIPKLSLCWTLIGLTAVEVMSNVSKRDRSDVLNRHQISLLTTVELGGARPSLQEAGRGYAATSVVVLEAKDAYGSLSEVKRDKEGNAPHARSRSNSKQRRYTGIESRGVGVMLQAVGGGAGRERASKEGIRDNLLVILEERHALRLKEIVVRDLQSTGERRDSIWFKTWGSSAHGGLGGETEWRPGVKGL
ncbi:hypothetical protein BU24DRAFT_411964 [Aaosphaeria arxii CBS 175.79]|uniref:Uncharacterized protein n=1 Tax=Aaosphaeria arxii CBS 175.79 TaxID=1450172 RepID=A0A6A5XHM9_9PLEO|nr:uncharacterized protein BU24DRAFT_411964 [Aaosphaeria arxii CBS 175.79]KAF2012622.1 hypothetical protein BU24DRAFT_411964 [Aaosphaeria arxii CBS 175.79]